ncbi:MAG: GTPase [Pirellulaceae bacterium]
MSFDLNSTIVASAAGSGEAYRQIVRLSGPDAILYLRAVLAEPPDWLTAAQTARWFSGEVRLEAGRTLPSEIYVWPTSRSYTRQPLVELHLPGCGPLASEVVARLCAAGARAARPGEFTMRAFLAGRLDLAQAEAVLGLIDAQGDSQFQTALTQLAGGLSGPLAEARRELLELLAHLEAGLDFAEEDIEFISQAELMAGLSRIESTLATILRQLGSRDSHNPVIKVALVGLPNAGKSSLFNALLGNDQAIVSELAGTTRDYVLGELELGDLRFQFIDTAGLEEAVLADQDQAETGIEESMRRQSGRMREEADLVLHCIDTTRGVTPLDTELLRTLETERRLIVATKCDAARSRPLEMAHLKTSAVTGLGLESLRELLRQAALQLQTIHHAMVPGTAARCRASLASSQALVTGAMTGVMEKTGEELVASDLRAALDCLAQVVGAVYTDHILDVIFSRFCIGK